MKLTSLALTLLALAGGLVIAGCGDEDEPESEPQALTDGATGASGAQGSLDKAGFIAAADEICADASKEVSKEGSKQYPEGPPEGQDAVVFAEDHVIPSVEAQYDGIAALPVPEGEEEAVADILSKLQAGIDELRGDPGGFVTTDAFEEAAAAASDFGMKVCSGE